MLKLQIPINGSGKLFEFKLDKSKVTIGRRHDNDIRIKESFVSAYHAEFTLEPDGRVFLRDRDSSNGTRLNGAPVSQQVPVSAGDVIRFGSLDCVIADTDSVAKNSLARVEELSEPADTTEQRVKALERELLVIQEKLVKICTEAEQDELDYCEEISRLKKELSQTRAEKGKLGRDLKALLARSRESEVGDKSCRCHAEPGREAIPARFDAEDARAQVDKLEGEKRLLARQTEQLEEALGRVRAELDKSRENLAALGEKNGALKREVALLENELSQLRESGSALEKSYRLKLEEAELKRQDLSGATSGLLEELSASRELCRRHEEKILKLNEEITAMTSVIAAFQQKNSGIEALESRRLSIGEDVGQLISRRNELEEEIARLADEKKKLGLQTEKARAERDEADQWMEDLRGETEKAAHKLDLLQQRLRESEKKVTYLRSLEAELEKSVLRAQRSALSRKGIYAADEEETISIWPETEQIICRELIERLELLDDMVKRFQKSWFFPNIAEQLNLLKESFMKMLKDHNVERFDLAPGTELSVESRKKIQLVSVEDFGDPRLKKCAMKNASDRPTVIETIRAGYVYTKGGQDIIIRKAEVIVA